MEQTNPVLACHVDARSGQGETDQDDDGADHDRREQPLDEADAEQFDKKAHQHVDHTHGDQSAEHAGQPVQFRGFDDRSDERETAPQVDGNFSAGDQVEKKRAETGSEEGDGRVETDQKRDKHRGSECHEHELNADYRALQRG